MTRGFISRSRSIMYSSRNSARAAVQESETKKRGGGSPVRAAMFAVKSVLSAVKKDNNGGSWGASSGEGASDDGTFTYGYYQLRGKRSSMEDCQECRVERLGGVTVGLFGVFDGHGGSRAAEYVKEHLFNNLIKHPKFISDTPSAIAETFQQTDSDLLQKESEQSRDVGSTASTAVLMGNRLLVANVGDSRTIMCKGGTASPMSRDHKPNRSDERERIEQAGGAVLWAGTWRVGGVLAVSRAFGDKQLKRFVVAEPEIKEVQLHKDDEFLVMASDGLWDVIKEQEAVALIRGVKSTSTAAKQLVEEAFRRGSADNITCVVVRFNHHN
eukprot:TRINITY_DN755_c0_g1_i4.p1 TRINITY_DN755_c0_g1~~TRINITY_DN755_c0_g1_i4.p1  ORF type:complete len:327 (+),score=71.77 TRINITY_DN755_c0_g1_i4:182-1162(+)